VQALVDGLPIEFSTTLNEGHSVRCLSPVIKRRGRFSPVISNFGSCRFYTTTSEPHPRLRPSTCRKSLRV
jgi:hypothetical protein